MKLADFCKMVDWMELNNQYINVVMPIKEPLDKTDLKNNEMIKRALFICSEFSPREVEFYDEIGITPKTENDELVFIEDEYGWKLVEDVYGNFYVVF